MQKTIPILAFALSLPLVVGCQDNGGMTPEERAADFEQPPSPDTTEPVAATQPPQREAEELVEDLDDDASADDLQRVTGELNARLATLQRRVQELGGQAEASTRDAVEEARTRLQEAQARMDRLRQATGERAEQAREEVKDSLEEAADKIEDARESLEDR